jgi:hypothetical protein
MELSDQLHAPGRFTPWERTTDAVFYRRLGGYQNRSGRVGEEINRLLVSGIETPPAHMNTVVSIS